MYTGVVQEQLGGNCQKSQTQLNKGWTGRGIPRRGWEGNLKQSGNIWELISEFPHFLNFGISSIYDNLISRGSLGLPRPARARTGRESDWTVICSKQDFGQNSVVGFLPKQKIQTRVPSFVNLTICQMGQIAIIWLMSE